MQKKCHNHGYRLIKGSRILILEKLTLKELYQILISSSTNKIETILVEIINTEQIYLYYLV